MQLASGCALKSTSETVVMVVVLTLGKLMSMNSSIISSILSSIRSATVSPPPLSRLW